MAKCSALAAVRDENTEIIRDILTGKALTRPCRNNALTGTNPPTCIMHCTPLERQKRMQKTFMKRHGQDVSDLLFALDLPDQHPMDGLLEAVRMCGNMMRVFQVLVSELGESPTVVTTVDETTGVPIESEIPGLWGHDHNRDQAPHVLLNLLSLWTDRYTRACKMALDAGIDERLVRNAEATSTVFLTAFDRALKTIELSDTQRIAISQAMAREVRQAVEAPRYVLEESQ